LTARPYRLARILVLPVLGWWLIQALVLTGHAQPHFEEEWTGTDFSQRNVRMEEITRGGPPRDGIPAIDEPEFVSTTAAAHWLLPQEPVIALEHGGEARAYPLQILLYHEIVNDRVAGTPVAVTFCPLCYSAIVFDRRVNGTTLDFGTTGRVRKSDLVMYDRQSESWWQQFTGTGLIGKYTGVSLVRLPSMITSFAVFRSSYPAGRVLSQATGSNRPYGNNPYPGYDGSSSTPFLFNEPLDPRLPPMERILALQVEDRQRIYPFSLLRNQPVINDILNGSAVAIFSKADVLSAVDAAAIERSRETLMAAAFDRELSGKTLTFRQDGDKIVDGGTGSVWNIYGKAVSGPLTGQSLTTVDSGIHFAFAWLAFYPETEIYAANKNPGIQEQGNMNRQVVNPPFKKSRTLPVSNAPLPPARTGPAQ
jgi:hypothetical protein